MLKKIFPHLCIIISLMIIVLYIIDGVNSAMGFLRGDVFKTLLLIYCIVSIITSLLLIVKKPTKHK